MPLLPGRARTLPTHACKRLKCLAASVMPVRREGKGSLHPSSVLPLYGGIFLPKWTILGAIVVLLDYTE
jgi:hypothetical protein